MICSGDMYESVPAAEPSERIDRLRGGRIDHRRRPARNPEVEHLHQPVFGDHHVRGFDVLVDQPIRVRCGQRIGHLAADVEDGVQRQRTLSGEIGQRPSGHVLHRNEAEHRAVVLDLVDLIHDRDIGMGQR